MIRQGVGNATRPFFFQVEQAPSMMSTALLPVISASDWILVMSSLIADRLAAIDALSPGVRYDGNRLECWVPGA